MGKACSKDISLPYEASETAYSGDVLYVVLPYFNYCGFERRTQLFVEFVERIKSVPCVRIIISEGALMNDTFLLPPTMAGAYMHFRFRATDHVWMKENLINLAVKKLPVDWKYMAWIDADLTFLNEDWARDTMHRLNSQYDVVQIFQTCINMGPCGEALKIDKSFGYMHCESGKPYHKTAKYGFWHPGFAHACTRAAYDRMGGLLDFGILGSGDRHMCLALIGLVEYSHPGNIHTNYSKMLQEYQARVKSLRFGWVPGTILHHWHGRLEDRKYQDRWLILTKQQFDPETDIVRNAEGVIVLTEKGKRLEWHLANYFVERREDNMTLT